MIIKAQTMRKSLQYRREDHETNMRSGVFKGKVIKGHEGCGESLDFSLSAWTIIRGFKKGCNVIWFLCPIHLGCCVECGFSE